MRSTLIGHDLRSGAGWLASAPAAVQDRFLSEIGEGGLCALPFLFEFWAMPHQLPPEGDWRSWVIMGGRGAGKTRAGAEWVRSVVEGSLPLDRGEACRVALVGETFDQVRDVMIFGDSGILQCSPPDRRPVWKASERKLVWPNGGEAQAFSAHDPEGLRGPQFDAAWVDELAKWKKAGETWDMLQFALRLGDQPRVCVTTTPRNVKILKDLLASPSTVQTHAPTEANRANLADSFLAEVRARYAGTRLGRQELDGVLLSDAEGALWTGSMLEAARCAQVPELDRIVVALDPAVTAGSDADACGIVVVGARLQGPPEEWRAFVLADRTVQGVGPAGWAQAAIDAMDEFGAERLVAEVNQGGQLVEEVVRQVDPLVPYRAVRASRGKVARAEPVAALYEQGRVAHVAGLNALEEQMCQMTAPGFEGQGSPDRVDALVWALHELVVGPAGAYRRPRVRAL
ncbi:DNA-packaging protein [uncultured Ruegeria sp.]|uniref:DNA-packaging protein n=1 Tax=uncultured Ruegeria sp. TaxID=259304 RepID=UPI00262A59C3|nr:terminase family protein [uncultured Ruegeria sp.]